MSTGSGPPKCRTCGKAEWRHVCLGPDESVLTPDPVANKPEPASIVKHTVKHMSNDVTNAVYKYRDAEKHREYMRVYMVDYRAKHRKQANSP